MGCTCEFDTIGLIQVAIVIVTDLKHYHSDALIHEMMKARQLKHKKLILPSFL